VATILMILLRINRANFVQFSIWLDERDALPVKGHSEDFRSRTPWNRGQDPEIKDCNGKSRTDGHLNVVSKNKWWWWWWRWWIKCGED